MGEMHRHTDDEKACFLRRMWAEGLTPASAARLWGNHPDGATVAGWLRQLAEGRPEVEPVRIPHSCEGGHEKHKRYPADTRREELRPMRLGVGSSEVARALGLPSDPKAGDPERLSNRQKAELGERLRRDYGFPLRRVLTYFRISKSSYEYERRVRESMRRQGLRARRGRRPRRPYSSYAG